MCQKEPSPLARENIKKTVDKRAQVGYNVTCVKDTAHMIRRGVAQFG